jgi:hypothetical protein
MDSNFYMKTQKKHANSVPGIETGIRAGCLPIRLFHRKK